MFYVYALFLAISVCVLVYIAGKNYATVDIYYWSIALIMPVILAGYMFKTRATSVGEAQLAFCFIYLDSTVLLLLMLLSMLRYLDIRIKTWIKITAYVVCLLHLASIWISKGKTWYYKTFEIIDTPMGTVTKMTNGPLKFTHYIYLGIVFVALVGTLVYAYIKKRNCSKKALYAYALIVLTGIILYIVEMTVDLDFSLLPCLYVVADIIIAVEYESIHSHDMNCIIPEQKGEHSTIGYVAFDTHRRLLCYNDAALIYMPELRDKRIDAGFTDEDTRLKEIFEPLFDHFKNNGENTVEHNEGDISFRCSISTFSMSRGGRPVGLIVEIRDTTVEQGYMNLITEYGRSLEQDVKDKTEHIRYIQQRIVLGMATIIENRDMNTGGHVRRTSDIIRIIVAEMKKQNVGNIDDVLADEIIRSAPMHDLGKISIDSSILNKPGRLTDEEYAIMKTHSARSGEIVKSILSGVEEPHFVQTAYCLARFHHERWDGKGYPERLAQYEIPIEARVMAVADVYDALVSKRCYKEPMSFDKAAEIMLDGMGTQFDPMMKPVFEGCREELEQYYIKHNEEE